MVGRGRPLRSQRSAPARQRVLAIERSGITDSVLMIFIVHHLLSSSAEKEAAQVKTMPPVEDVAAVKDRLAGDQEDSFSMNLPESLPNERSQR